MDLIKIIGMTILDMCFFLFVAFVLYLAVRFFLLGGKEEMIRKATISGTVNKHRKGKKKLLLVMDRIYLDAQSQGIRCHGAYVEAGETKSWAQYCIDGNWYLVESKNSGNFLTLQNAVNIECDGENFLRAIRRKESVGSPYSYSLEGNDKTTLLTIKKKLDFNPDTCKNAHDYLVNDLYEMHEKKYRVTVNYTRFRKSLPLT